MSAHNELRGLHGGFRQSMAWLHTWTGLIVGWLLFAIFLTGTLSFYRDEISVWMQPEIHASHGDAYTAQRALDRFALLAPNASSWAIRLPNERDPSVGLSWREVDAAPGKRGNSHAVLDAGSGEVVTPRDTRGGDFLYRFHFELYALERTTARWIVGAATMIMLVGIITGVVTHKKIFKDFFTFRPGKAQRSWLDAHNATAVLALPFHFMITYSGLLLLMYLLMPWGVDVAYPDDTRAYFSEVRGNRGNVPREEGGPPESQNETPAHSALSPIAPLLAYAKRQWPDMPIGAISVRQPAGPKPVIELRAGHGRSVIDRGATDVLRFDGYSGAALENPQRPAVSVVHGIYNSFTALHLLRFADPVLRALFFVAGLIGTAMVGTGLVLWISKRAPQRGKTARAPHGHRIVQALNVATIAGMPLAIAAYFWANRLMPATLPERAALEIEVFFTVWGLSLVHAIIRPYRRAWVEQLLLGALFYGALPTWAALAPASAVAITAWPGPVLGVAGVLMATGLASAAAAWKIHRHPKVQHKPRRRRAAAVTSTASRPLT